MYDLFNPAPDDAQLNANGKPSFVNNRMIEGLTYLPNFIDSNQQKELLNSINSENWLTDIKRRVQHYGYKYDYKARAINYSMFLGELPPWASPVAKKLFHNKFIDVIPDQLIVNEYEPGQGIANHVDCEPCFGDTIISISLGSYCIMDLINLKTKEKIEYLLEPGSLIALTGEARYGWTHGIASRKVDVYDGIKIDRKLRVSMTFRKVVVK
jgi:alkylated DNA repair dioxygenase AlkB